MDYGETYLITIPFTIDLGVTIFPVVVEVYVTNFGSLRN